MKVYDVVLNEEKGVYAISVVEQPATEELFIALKEQPQEIQLAEVDKKKRILMGVALVPDKKIYRKQNGEEFFIQFSKDTIEKAAHKFLSSGYQNQSTLEHELQLQGMSVVESWIVEGKQDKSRKYGFDYPEGSWMVSMKVNDENVWNEYVKKGKIKGFSIDGLFSLKELNHVNMSKENLVEGFKSWLKEEVLGQKTELSKETPAEPEKEQEEVKLGLAKLDNGTQIEFEGDTLEAGTNVFVLSEDKEKVPMPVGEYKLEDQKNLSVKEEGVAGEISEPTEEPTEEASMIDQLKEIVAQMAKEQEEKFDAKLKAAIEAKENEIKELKAELSNTEGAAPTKHAPKEVSQEITAKTAKGRLTQFLNTLN